MDETCTRHLRDEECTQNLLGKSDRKILLGKSKHILKKLSVRFWRKFNWLSIGSSMCVCVLGGGRPCENSAESSVSMMGE
jgi:hypothetical protein